MDIVGGATDSLCYAQDFGYEFRDAAHRVHLLFDRETDSIKVESRYGREALTITLKKPGALYVRLPSWLDTTRLHARTKKESLPLTVSNRYLCLPQPPVHTPIEVQFDLPTNELTLQHRTRKIRARLRGDQVIAMENFGADLTFFPEL
jgi:hypothetical protein